MTEPPIRITSEAELADALRRALARIGGARLDELLPRDRLEVFLAAASAPAKATDRLRRTLAPTLAAIVAELRADPDPPSAWLGPVAEAAVLDVVASPGLVHPDWVRAAFGEAAIENMVSDTLFGVLREFSTLLPKLLGELPLLRKMPLMGAGGIAQKIAAEVERLLEPEIRAFLKGGTKRALERATTFTIDHLDDPSSLELRRNLVRLALSRPASFHLAKVEDDLLAKIERAAVAATEHALARPALEAARARWLDRLYRDLGSRTLDDLSTAAGVDLRAECDAVARLLWPLASRLAGPLPGAGD